MRRPRKAGPSHNLVSSPFRVAREWRFLGLRGEITSRDFYVNPLWRRFRSTAPFGNSMFISSKRTCLHYRSRFYISLR